MALPILGYAKAPSADFFVSLQGEDGWSGKLASPNKTRTDGPFATLKRAMKAVREQKQSLLQEKRSISVLIRGGTYFLQEPIVFEKSDGGSGGVAITYAGYPKERVVFSGGHLIAGWKQGESNLWEARLPDTGYDGAPWNFRSLYVDGKRTYRARFPKTGYFHAAAKLDPTEAFKEKGFDRLQFESSDVRSSYFNQGDVEVIVFHRWVNSRLHIKSIDPGKNILSFDGSTPGTSRFYEIAKGTRYWLDNVKEAVTDPKDWYLDRKSRLLTYKGGERENPNKETIIAARLPYLFQVKNVENLRFEGLTFAHTHWESPNSAYLEGQSADNIGEAAVQLQSSSRIQIRKCRFTGLDGYALEIGPGSAKNGIANNYFYDLGAGAIKISGSKEKNTGQNVIENNLISNGGRLYPTGAGILLKLSDRNIVRHNDIFDFYYTGISVGWHWGYGDSLASDNRILSNKIYRIGQGVMSDLGGIYTLGVSGQTLIEGNVIHDVESFQEHNGWGIYFDEGSQDVLAKNNLVYRIRSGGFHQHYGKNNTVMNNIFAFSRFAQIQRTRDEPHHSFSFMRNVVYWNGGDPLLRKNWYGSGYKLDYNLYWNASGAEVKFPDSETKRDNYSDLTKSFADWQMHGQDMHSIFADPLFVNASKHDFRLRKNSPIARVGFKMFDFSKAGRGVKSDAVIRYAAPSFATSPPKF